MSYPVLWSVWPAPGSAWCWADCTAGPERCSSLPWLWRTGLCSPVQMCNGVYRSHRPDSATSSSLLHQLPAGHEIWPHSSALTPCPLETLRSHHHHQHPYLKSKSQINHVFKLTTGAFSLSTVLKQTGYTPSAACLGLAAVRYGSVYGRQSSGQSGLHHYCSSIRQRCREKQKQM